jgi:hypothetical protein
MPVVDSVVSSLGPAWTPVIAFAWLLWELYCPIPGHTTKIQQYHEDMTARLERIEVTQIALSEEVAGVNESRVKEVHGQEDLSVSELKDGS